VDNTFTLPDTVASAASHVRFHFGLVSGNFGNCLADSFSDVARNGSHASAKAAMAVISRNLRRFICVEFLNELWAMVALSALLRTTIWFKPSRKCASVSIHGHLHLRSIEISL
jgi:hypothetical protein